MNHTSPVIKHVIWAGAAVFVVVVVVVFLLVNSFYRVPAKIAETIADALTNENITMTFSASLPHLGADDGMKLELLVLDEVVHIDSLSEKLFGDVTTGIEVPVTYRYHIRLDDPWKLSVREHSCLVRAPMIRPSLPPAIQLNLIMRQIEETGLRFDGAHEMEKLEQHLVNRVKLWAADESHINLIREQCRVRVAEFVRNWLLEEDHWKEGRFREIRVVFDDEKTSPPGFMNPTLTLEIKDER